MSNTTEIKPDWWYIGLDARNYWRIPSRFEDRIDKLLLVCAFNRNERTNCCELTPSYYLHKIVYDVHVKAGVDDALRQEIYDFIAEGASADDSGYYHVSLIEQLLKQTPTATHHLGREFIDEDDDDSDVQDKLHDIWHSNPKF